MSARERDTAVLLRASGWRLGVRVRVEVNRSRMGGFVGPLQARQGAGGRHSATFEGTGACEGEGVAGRLHLGPVQVTAVAERECTSTVCGNTPILPWHPWGGEGGSGGMDALKQLRRKLRR